MLILTEDTYPQADLVYQKRKRKEKKMISYIVIAFIIGAWVGVFVGALAVAQCNKWAAEAERLGYKE